MRRSSWFFKVYPYLPIGFAVIILLLPDLLTGKVLFWGTPSLQFVPWMFEAFNQIKQGIFPLWNPLNGMGAPLLANYQSALLYPINWLLYPLYLLDGAAGIAWGYTFLLMLHLFWAGAGMVMFVKSLEVRALGQAVAGISFGLCGYLVARCGFISIIWTVSWLPWVMAFAMRFIQSLQDQSLGISIRWRYWLLMTGSILMLLLAGHAQLAWYSLIFTGFWIGFYGWITYGLKRGWMALGYFLGAGILASGLAAIQLLPTLEYLIQSQRASSVNYEAAMTYSFWGWRFLTFLAPDLFGNPGLGDYWGYANFWEDAVYVGVLPLLLAFSTIKTIFEKSDWQRKQKRITIYLWAWIIIASLLALGKNTPVFPFLYKYIPTFDMFHAPTRYMIWTVFSLAILAGLGADRWKTPAGRGLYFLRLATAGSFAVSLGAFLAWGLLKEIDATFIRATALAGLWGLGAGLLTLFQFRAQQEGVNLTAEDCQSLASSRRMKWQSYLWYLIAAGWLAADLIVSGWFLIPTIDQSFYRDHGDSLNSEHRLFIPADDEYELKFKRYFLFTDYSPDVSWTDLRKTLLPNLNLFDGVRMVNNFDPLLPERYVRWMGLLHHLNETDRIPYLQWMDVGLIRTADKQSGLGFHDIPIDSPTRFRWYPCASFVTSGEEVLMKLRAINPSQYLFLEGNMPNELCSDREGEIEWQILIDAPNRLVARVNSSEDGWLLLADTWYPGWAVWVDGKVSHLFPANFIFKAVEVPSGDHRVEFRYQPVMFFIGSGISAACLALSLFLVLKKAVVKV